MKIQDVFNICLALKKSGVDIISNQLKGLIERSNTFRGTFENKDITIVGPYAFYSCTRLNNVILKNVTGVLKYGFSNCANLLLADLGKCSIIQTYSFESCGNLNTLILRNNTMCTISNVNAFNSSGFSANKSGGTVYVPQAILSDYQNDSKWATVIGYNANNELKAIEGSIYE